MIWSRRGKLEEQNKVWKPRRKRKLSSLIECAMKSRQILKSDSKIGGTDKVRGKYARQFGAIETHAQSTKLGPSSEGEETKHHEKRGREGRIVDETSVGSVDKFQGWGKGWGRVWRVGTMMVGRRQR
jgi:hypothetical protein